MIIFALVNDKPEEFLTHVRTVEIDVNNELTLRQLNMGIIGMIINVVLPILTNLVKANRIIPDLVVMQKSLLNMNTTTHNIENVIPDIALNESYKIFTKVELIRTIDNISWFRFL